MVADYFAIFSDVYHVEGVQPVLTINVDFCIDVFQHKHNPGRDIVGCFNNGVHTMRCGFNITITLDIVEQIKAEFVQTKVHDGNTAGHIFNVHDFFL